MADNILGSLFEEGYLLRDLKDVAQVPEVALAELVANAWDAGASSVEISIPHCEEGILSVTDNGAGITRSQFRDRWMKHGYNRLIHQGPMAEIVSNTSGRRAFGRNGIGRHGLLCFADEYFVESRAKDEEECWRFRVKPSSGDSAFVLVSEESINLQSPGTKVWTQVKRSLPDVNRIIDSLSFKFLHDPQFTIHVNGQPITLADHNIIRQDTIAIRPGLGISVLCVEKPTTKTRAHGVAFWVGGRLVGEPIYNLSGVSLLDGRTTVANRHMFIVKSDDLFDDIEPDWTGFRRTPRVELVANAVGNHLDSLVATLTAEKIGDNKMYAMRENRDGLKKLQPLGRIEISEFVDELVGDYPTLNVEILTAAVKAAVNLEKSRSGRELLEKLGTISEDDADRINQLLDNWTLRDAMAVLDEIDRRISIVEALKKLMGDSSADELHSIHPLVTHARWLFGPEYDSPIYASNITIQNAAKHVFKKKIDTSGIANLRQRPDLIFTKQATISFTGTECFDDKGTVVKLGQLLVIELKKGAFTVTSKEVQQATQYVTDLLSCRLLDGPPFVRAFVVGHKVDSRARIQQVGKDPVEGVIEPISFGQLVRTAEIRLFRLQSTISDRYKDVPGLELVNKIIGDQQQVRLFDPEEPKTIKKRRSGSISS